MGHRWSATAALIFSRGAPGRERARSRLYQRLELSVSAGEVILYERNQRLFVHRVLWGMADESAERGASLLITKGDAPDGKDAPASGAEFLGRVTRIHRGQRHIDLDFLGRTLPGRVVAFASPASFLVYRPLRILKQALFAKSRRPIDGSQPACENLRCGTLHAPLMRQ